MNSPGCLTPSGTALLRATLSQPVTNSYYLSLTLNIQGPLHSGAAVSSLQSYRSFFVCSPLTPTLSPTQIWANKSPRGPGISHGETTYSRSHVLLPTTLLVHLPLSSHSIVLLLNPKGLPGRNSTQVIWYPVLSLLQEQRELRV